MSEVRASNVEAVIARVKTVYGRWGRQTTVAEMRADWDRLFAAHGDARTQDAHGDVYRDASGDASGDASADASGYRDAFGDAAITDVVLSGVPCRWVAAPGAREDRVVVYFHGGGFQVGSLDSHRELMAALSVACGARVLGVGYRLAPEHRYPAALDDAVAVVEGLHGEGFDPSQIALAGDSAGAGLALSTLLSLQGAGRPLPVAAYLMSAWTDLTASGPSYETRAALDPIHQRPMILAMARNYLGKDRDPSDPLASPLMASAAQLGALPPLLLQVGERETVVSDSERFVDKVVGAGGRAELQVWPGMIHGFQQFPSELPEARAAIRQGGRLLAAQLGIEPHREHAS